MYLEKIDFHEFIESFVEILETKDTYTRGHSTRVAHYAILIAEKMKLNDREIELCHFAGHLHDIGKIGVPDSILTKKSKLSSIEYEQIKKHSEFGYNILNKVSSLVEMAEIVRAHHERWDGKGYPDGLSGEKISLISRILAVADSFDAMTSNRSYRKTLNIEEAIIELKNNKWQQFDGNIVDIFVEVSKTLNNSTFKDDIKNYK